MGEFAAYMGAWPEPALLVTGEGRLEDANSAALNTLGLNRHSLVGLLLGDLVSDPPEAVGRLLERCRRTRGLSMGSLTWRSQEDGTDGLKLRAEGTLLESGDGPAQARVLMRLRPKESADRRFQGLNERIADLGREVNARRRAESALLQNRARLEFVLDATGVGLWLNQLPFGELNWDAQTRSLYFVSPDVQPTIDLFYERLHPDDREPTRDSVAEAIANRSRYEIDHRVNDPESGATRWVRSIGMATYGADGTPIRFDGISYDISDRKAIETELRGLAEQLKDTDRLKDAFMATLAHELRNPLAPLRTGLEILRMKPDDPETVKAMQVTMERQVQQLNVLVSDLLDVSRGSRGKIEIRPEKLKLKQVLTDGVDMSRPLLDEAGHTFDFALPDESIEIEADPYRLSQVVSNLLNNASKYTPPGGQIRLEAGCDGEEIVITVQDNGQGIPAAELDNVFDMFIQLPSARSDHLNSGLGVGLTLVKKLVDLHGGRVRARSAGVNQGSTFEVRLPASRRAD